MADIGALPVELLDMILNGLDAQGTPFFDPRWRFAARATHPLWRDLISAEVTTGTHARVKAYSRAWRAPSANGTGDKYACQCDYGQHDDFKESLALGRIVSSRCAVGRPWVLTWCSKDGVPPQDRAAIALLSMAAPVIDTRVVCDLVAPYIQGDALTGPFPVRPIRGDFWHGIKRAHPDGDDDDAGWSCCDSEFLYDVTYIICGWNRADLMRPLMDAYATPRVINNVLFCACCDDAVEIVEDALVHADKLCDGGAKSGPHKWRLWKEAARWGGSRVLEYLLRLCAHDEADVTDNPHNSANSATTTTTTTGQHREAAQRRAARLARPETDLTWQKHAVRRNNTDALVVGERYGVPIRVHELIETAADRGNDKTVLWLLARASDTRDPSTSIALAQGCALALGSIVDRYDCDDWRFDARNVCQCFGRSPRKASPKGDGGVGEILTMVDTLCNVMSPMLTTDDGVVVVRQFINRYLARPQHAAEGIALVVRAIERWPASVAGRFKPLGWRALVRAAVATGAIDALDQIINLIATRSSCDLSEIDLWGIATDCVGNAIRAAVPPLPFSYCKKCPALSLLCKRDRAAALVAHILATLYGHASTDEAARRTWRSLCRPRPLPAAALGDSTQDSASVASLRALMVRHGLVYS
ncbi:hypothetical protein psal_cds_253 [Pandoravirus salinus]|uniref:F-box incomplete domain containing protein n=1 Tax=Pandoravirus salinus TaxID=1349410 RepID=S4VWJ1_9VIRU|nr:hypothetical protein psal_cds_253 [Pandoravirus salinus]AGO83811.1 hypothetical protein psal_cds_253 [Pandoravirus salinus]